MKTYFFYSILLLFAGAFLSSCKDNCNHERCELKPDAGDCEAAIPKYYFDVSEGICKEFLWGGCELPEVILATKLSKNRIWKSLGYLIIMLVPGYFMQQFTTWKNNPFLATLTETVKFMLFCLLVGYLLEAFRLMFRRLKEKRSAVIKRVDPFWFQGIESGFSVWVLFSVLFIFIHFFYY